MSYVHGTSPLFQAPAGWLQSTSHTTVRAVTIKNAAGRPIAGAALTATTTTTTLTTAGGAVGGGQGVAAAGTASAGAASGAATSITTATATASTSSNGGGSSSSSSTTTSRGAAAVGLQDGAALERVLGHLSRHSRLHAAQLAAAATASLPAAAGGDAAAADIELHPQRVAAVVARAKAAQQLTRLIEQGEEEEEGAGGGGGEGGAGPRAAAATSAEEFAGLYGAGGAGSVVFAAHDDLRSCPRGSASPQGATAVVLLAHTRVGPARLKAALDGLLLLYSQAGADIRGAFHLYAGLDGDDAAATRLAQRYAHDSLGALKLVHRAGKQRASSNSGTPGRHRQLQQQQQQQHGGGAAAAASAEHVQLMLHVFLRCLNYPSLLLVEAGWRLAPDFLEYFDATHWLLTSDPSLHCASAWNPLGQQQQQLRHAHAGGLLRSDANPGGGWMLTRATGLQLLGAQAGAKASTSSSWRQFVGGALQGRQCIVPEMPRMAPDAVPGQPTLAAASSTATPGTTAAGSSLGGAGSAQQPAAAPDGTAAKAAPGAAPALQHQPAGHVRPSATAPGGGAAAPGASAPAAGADVGALDLAAADADEADEAGRQGQLRAAAAEMAAPAPEAAGWGEEAAAAVREHVPLPHSSGGGDGGGAAAQHGGAGAGGAPTEADVAAELARSSWLGRDLSFLMAPAYRRLMQQRLLAARPLDAAAAAGAAQGDSTAAVLVVYGSAAELAAAAARLGLQLEVAAGQEYCYKLPTTPPEQHCQAYLPGPVVHDGIVTAYNQQGVMVLLAHTAYVNALRGSRAAVTAKVASGAGAAAAA